MAGPTPAVAAVRLAVREALAGLAPDSCVLVACSGGADSVALAAALAFEAPRVAGGGLRAGGVTVDHRLQEGSGERAAEVARLLTRLGLDPVESVAVDVVGPGGPEAAARAARYAALDAAAQRHGGGHHRATVLLGHTLDDQAETVLLGLARGSGTRSLAGMAAVSGVGGRYRRPLLGLSRAVTRAACADERLPVWDDPHNADPAYTRVRVRHHVMPALEKALGPGVAAALARTAELARADADALDGWARVAYTELAASPEEGVDAGEMARLPLAVRSRVLRLAMLAAGATAGSLGAAHVAAAEALVSDWRGQGAVNLPGGVLLERRYGRLYLRGVDQHGSDGAGG